MNCAVRSCSPIKLSREVNFINRFSSWKGFPKYVSNSIRPLNKPSNSTTVEAENNDSTIVLFRISYLGGSSQYLKNSDKFITFKVLYCNRFILHNIYKIVRYIESSLYRNFPKFKNLASNIRFSIKRGMHQATVGQKKTKFDIKAY